jgi:cytochrome c553
MKRLAFLAAMAACAPVASAQDPIEEKAQLCAACHGENGVPTQPDVPVIWGQHTGYLYIQLKDYKSGLRKNEKMDPIVADLEKADMLALAEYFAKKEWPRSTYRSAPEDEAKGETIAAAGLCKECHLGGYVGDSSIPRLAGQTVTYLEATMLAFKSRQRANNPDKSTLLASYSEDDLKTMARYLAGLQ